MPCNVPMMVVNIFHMAIAGGRGVILYVAIVNVLSLKILERWESTWGENRALDVFYRG